MSLEAGGRGREGGSFLFATLEISEYPVNWRYCYRAGLALLLSPPLRPRPLGATAGGRTNAKSACTVAPRMVDPFSPSTAVLASRCVSYSTSA